MGTFKIGSKEIDYRSEEELAYLQQCEEGMDLGVDDHECECESYLLGDHRCSCGNRRICVTVESFDGKFFLRTEAY